MLSKGINANILSKTLNTRVSSPKGKISLTLGKDKQNWRMDSMFILVVKYMEVYLN